MDSRLSSCLPALLMVFFLPVAAQGYPSKPIKLVVPFPTGGTNDLVGRVVAEKLAQPLNQSVIVENRAGAGGVIGTDAVAKAPADGYTLLVGNAGALAMGLSIFPKVPYDVMKDFAPISKLAEVTVVLAVHPSVQAKSVKQLIALAKAHPGKLSMALPGLVTPSHLLSELFRQNTGINFVLVPYKGGGPAVIDLVSGQVDMIFQNVPSILEFIRAGRARAIAVASEQRSELLPEIHTMIEAGVPATASGWMVLAAPANTPKQIVERLNAEVVKLMRGSEMKQILGRQGAVSLSSTPEETYAFIRDEISKWAKVVKEANIRLE